MDTPVVGVDSPEQLGARVGLSTGYLDPDLSEYVYPRLPARPSGNEASAEPGKGIVRRGIEQWTRPPVPSATEANNVVHLPYVSTAQSIPVL